MFFQRNSIVALCLAVNIVYSQECTKFTEWSFLPENYSFVFLDWQKILPEVCTTKVNDTQIRQYNGLINTLLEDDIIPVVILYSGNLPPLFDPLGGWSNPTVVQYFVHYARIVFKIFGDRVKEWITFHEPKLICQSINGDEFYNYLCNYNALKGHSEVYHVYNKEFKRIQNGTISIAYPGKQTNTNLNFITDLEYSKIVMEIIENKRFASWLPKVSYAEKAKIVEACDYVWVTQKKSVFKEENMPTCKNMWSPQEEKCAGVQKWISKTYQNFRVLMMED